MYVIKTEYRPRWQRKLIEGYNKKAPNNFYGEDWIILSIGLRKALKRCQWCNKKFSPRELQVHHIGCVKFNLDQKFDRRILLVVCDTCHHELEPWSRINLTQMLPQLFE